MLLLVISNRYYKLTMEWARLIVAILLCMVVFAVCNVMSIGISHQLWGKFVITLVALAVIWMFWVDREEKNHIVAYLKHYKR